MSEERPTERSAAALRSRARDAAPVLLAGAALLALLLATHGLLPGLVNDGPWNLLIEGDLRCLDRMGLEALRGVCDQFGQPGDYRFLTSGPFIAVGWLFMQLPGVGSYGAYLLTAGIFDAVALTGGYLLMRRLGAGRGVALGTAAVWLLAPSVVGLRMFGGTFTGFTLLPAYALADLLAMRALERWGGRRLAAALAGYVLLRAGALFLDGYSFVVSALLSVALWLPWLLSGAVDARRRLLGAATVVGAPLAAYGLYAWYAPELVDPAALELFRAMGLDLSTLLRPSEYLWAAHLLGVATERTDLWGDGSNALFNYVGVACAGLAVFGAWARRREPHVAAIAAAGAIAFVLSLGPALKVDDARPVPLGGVASITYDTYLMPEDEADVELPWAGAFTAVPGLEQMRAIYRWSALTRLALVVLAGLAVDLLLRRRRRALALALACVAVVELAPDVSLLVTRQHESFEYRAAFLDDVVPELSATTTEGELVFLRRPGGSGVDYTVNYLVPTAGLRAYNAGGDKNAARAAAAWPPEIAALAAPEVEPDAVAAAFASGELDAVVLTYFDLRLAAYRWPPAPAEVAGARAAHAPLLTDPRFRVDRRRWLAVVRPAELQ